MYVFDTEALTVKLKTEHLEDAVLIARMASKVVSNVKKSQ